MKKGWCKKAWKAKTPWKLISIHTQLPIYMTQRSVFLRNPPGESRFLILYADLFSLQSSLPDYNSLTSSYVNSSTDTTGKSFLNMKPGAKMLFCA
uniref:Uncharacterized protein n=1 Tax=Monopterus albus TaxID=43700 RepID=A0A3Q3IGG1_MONAL